MAVAGGKFTEGGVARQILVMTSTSALSLFAVFLVDILTLVYVSMLHDPMLLAAVGIAKVLIFLKTPGKRPLARNRRRRSSDGLRWSKHDAACFAGRSR